MSQQLYEALTTDEINGLLHEGAMLVWVARAPLLDAEDHWDVVLEHPEYTEPGAVLAFLESVNPGALDEAMLKGSRLSESPGTAALNALRRLAAGDGP